MKPTQQPMNKVLTADEVLARGPTDGSPQLALISVTKVDPERVDPIRHTGE